LPEIVDDVLQVAQGSRETVDPSDHQSVALAKKLKQRRQFLPAIGAGSGHLLGPHHGAAGGGEGIKLDGKVLIDGRNACVPRRAFPSSRKCLKTVCIDI
jgi:hypothetical protein